MSIASEPKHCPKCQTPLPGDAPQGLCPKCLLAAAAVPTESGQPAPDKTPPSLAELAAAFPQLEILELIGQGGMGFVFKARQPKLDRFVALKILPQSLAADPAFAERFSREGRVLAKLNHPNIVTIHDFGVASGRAGSPLPAEREDEHERRARSDAPNPAQFYYLLMEFVDGVNLRQAMRAGRFTPNQALAIVPKICEALQFAHNEGILHRDIKPENILLDAKGRVKIADFGIAKLVAAVCDRRDSAEDDLRRSQTAATENLTETGKALGTPNYMAPEQQECSGEVDQRADIYSLGVVFYEMLTGELPLGRFAPPSEKSAADPRVDEVVLRALEKEKAKRYASADEVKTQVETITATPPISAGAPPHAELPFWRRVISKSPSLWCRFLEKFFYGTTLISPTAVRLANLSELGFLGFLGSLGFLGEVPIPGMQHCKGFFGLCGFFGFFGAIGHANMVEIAQRRKAKQSVEPAAITLTPAEWERARWLILIRAFIMCVFGAVLGFYLYPPMIGIAITCWGFIGIIVVSRKALGFRRSPAEDRQAITTAGQIGLVHAIGILSAGLRIARINSGLTEEWNLFLAALFGFGIVVCLMGFFRVFALQHQAKKAAVAQKGDAPKRTVYFSCLVAVLPMLAIWFLSFVFVLPKIKEDSWTNHPNGVSLSEKLPFSGLFEWLGDHWTARAFLGIVALVVLAELLLPVWRRHRRRLAWTVVALVNGATLLTLIGVFAISMRNPSPSDTISQTIQNEVGRQLRETGASYDGLQVTVAEERDSGTPFTVSYRGLRNFKYTHGGQPDPQWPASANGQFIMEYIGGGQWQGKLGDRQFTVQAGCTDNIDLPFVDDPQILGTWESVNFVDTLSDFNLDAPKPKFLDAPCFNDVTFLAGGRTLSWWRWTKGVVIHQGDKTASHYEIQDIKGQLYMFVEWKSGDVMLLGMKPKYWVLKKSAFGPVIERELTDADLTLAEQPPVVVETFPVAGARDVPSGETEIRVRFSKPMADGSWSWSTAWEGSLPAFIGQPHYEADGKTCVLKVKLEAGRTYGFWLNSEKFKKFADRAGQPAVPYLLIFQTKQQQ